MGRLVAAAVLMFAALLGAAAPSAADPADLVPYCSGDQTPMDSNCNATSSQIIVHDGTGLTPNTPIGLTPNDEPAV